LLFSCTDESFPNRGPNTPVNKNHIKTTSIAIANGLRDFTEVLDDTAVGTFHTYFSEDSRLGKPTFRLSPWQPRRHLTPQLW
jgi:hypothetical protein